MEIDAIILAGGLGTRLKNTIGDQTPKPLALIQNQPFLDLLLQQLENFKKIKKVVLAVSYLAQSIIQRYQTEKHSYSFQIDFSIEEKPLGTGGAIKKAIKKTDSSPILVLNGDSYTDFNLGQLIEEHSDQKNRITLTLIQVEDSSRYGQVIFNPKTKKILAFHEKNGHNEPSFINAGVYLINRDDLDSFPNDQTISMEKEVLPNLISSGLHAFLSNGYFIDIGTPESYLLAQSELKKFMVK